MTLFDNIHLGTEVEVARHGRICLGKVRWKGHLVTKQGDWIGVELNQPGNFCIIMKKVLTLIFT